MRILVPLALSALLSPTLGLALDVDDEKRTVLARAVVEYLELDASGARPERKRKLDDRIERLLRQLGVDAAHADAYVMALVRELQPEALNLFEKRLTSAPREHTLNALLSLNAGLLQWSTGHYGVMPTSEAGLAVLLASEPHGPLVDESSLRDGWGQAIVYTRVDEYSFTLRSVGPDGSSATSDDLFLDTEGELHEGPRGKQPEEATPAAEPGAPSGAAVRDELCVRLTPGDAVRELAPGPVPGSIVYIVRRPDEYVIGFDEQRFGGFDRHVKGTVVGDVAQAALVHGVREGQRVLVTPAGEVTVEHMLVGKVRFLQGSTDYAYNQTTGPLESFWTIHSTSGAQADSPAFDADGVFLAYRKRVDDGWLLFDGQTDHGPYPWISPPRVLENAGAEVLCYRYWDGDQTTLICGDRQVTSTWVGNPIVSPDGQHIAFSVTAGGAPRRPFFEARDDNSFEGADHWYVVDWQYSSFAFPKITDLLFAPDGSRWTFRAQDAEGRWHAIAENRVDGVVAPPSLRLSEMLFDRGGTHVHYASIQEGESVNFVIDVEEKSLERGVNGRFREVIAGNRGAFAYHVEDDDKKWLCIDRPGQQVAVHGPYDDVRLHGFSPQSNRVVAAVESQGSWQLYAGSFDDETVDWVSEPLLLDDGTVVFCTRAYGEYYIKCIEGLATEFDAFGPFAALGEPVGFGARVAVCVNKGGESIHSPYGFPAWSGGETSWLTRGPQGWTRFAREGALLSYAAPDQARLALTFTHEGRQSITLLGQRQEPLGSIEAERLGQPQFLANGTLVCEAENDGHRSIAYSDDRSSPSFEHIDQFALTPDRKRPVFRARVGERQLYMFGERREPLFDGVDDELVWSADGRTCAYRFGTEDEHAYRGLRIATIDGSFEHEIEADFVSLPVFTSADRSVRCAVHRGDGLHDVEVTLPGPPGAR